MTTEQLLQEVQELRTQTLTPVSPKPIHFPQPSNIPLLDISMDAEFENTTTPSVPGQNTEPPIIEGSLPEAIESPADTTKDSHNNDGSVDGGTMQSNEVSADHDMTVGTVSQAPTDDEAISAAIKSSLEASSAHSATPAPQLNDAALAFLQSLVMSSAVSAAPTPFTSNALAQPNDLSQAANVPTDEQQSATANPDDVTMKDSGSGPINFDTLLDNLATPQVTNQAQSQVTTGQDLTEKDVTTQDTGPPGIHQTPIRLIPTVPGLPARPPVHQAGSEIRTQLANDSVSALSNVPYQSQQTVNANMPTNGDDGMPVLTNASYQQQVGLSTPTTQQQQEFSVGNGFQFPEPEDEPFSPELQKLYDDFLADERNNLTINEWDKFPVGSRLFIGNLPSEKVTKPDIFRVFHKHGKLAQISIKQAYGFAQYYAAESCARALEMEQAVTIRGRKIHLEVSKPQRNKNQQNDNRRQSNQQRRSRSPDYGRGSTDRYRNNDIRQSRVRDGYRPRSPSPRRGYGRRSPDRYDARRRSRSRSPFGQGGRYPSMDQRPAFDDDCPLPRRRPEQIPDIQIIAQQPPERSFIQYVERAFESRGVKCDVLLLSPRLPEAGVLRRQIIEGVHAVMKLEKPVQYTNKFPLSIFDRSTPGNVRFEEYQDLDLPICVELVLRAKQNAVRVSTPQQYAAPPAYSYGNAAGPPPPSSLPPPPIPPQYMQNNMQRGAPPPLPPMPPQLDAASIQRLLGQLPPPTPSLQQQQQYPTPQHQQQQPGQPPMPAAADLARLLVSAGAAQTPQPHQQQQHQQPYGLPLPPSAGSYAPPPVPAAQQQNGTNAYQSLLSNPALAALLKGSASATPQQGQGAQYQYQYQQHQQQQQQQQQGGGGGQQAQQPDMQNIMAKLARYG